MRFDEFRSAKKAVASLLRSHVKPSGAAPQFMDLLDGLFHPHNLTYVRCCQASLFSPFDFTLLEIIQMWQAALCSAIIREHLDEASQWGEALMGAARMVKGTKAHLELASRLLTVLGGSTSSYPSP